MSRRSTTCGENTTLSEHEVRTETDRYIAWPGQALVLQDSARSRLWALRRRAEQALGPTFDLRTFHDAVLAEGTITLPMLERRIDAHVAATARSPGVRLGS